MKSTFLTSLLLGMVTGPAAAFAAAPIHVFEVHNGDNAGRKWENNNPQNNDQRGAGLEHGKCSALKTADGKPRIVCIGTASYTDISNAQQVNIANTRIQGLCAAYDFDAVAGLKPVVMKYISKNNSPDYQNYHKVWTTPVLDGTAVLSMYGYDPNGVNTATYAQVIGPNCENLLGQEFAQTQIIAKNNDNVGGVTGMPMLKSGPSTAASTFDSPTRSQRIFTVIGNGNGTDDGWLLRVDVKKTGDKVTAQKAFDLSIVNNEERSRAECVPTANGDEVTCCWAEGNTQPPNDGVRCGLINVSDAPPNGQRILWKKYIKQKTGNLYYSTPSLQNVTGPDGSPTSQVMLSYVQVDTTGRNGRTKGKTTQYTVPFKVAATGPTMTDEPKTNLFGIGDGAHPGICGTLYGKEKQFAGFLINPTITDGGVASGAMIGLDAAGKIKPMKAYDLGVSVAGGWISQYYGQNPNTPQGRTYHPACDMVSNPGFGVQGGFEPLVEKFLMVPVSGTKKRNDGKIQDKLAFDVLLVPAVEHSATDPIQPEDPTKPSTPSQPDPTSPTDDDTGPSSGSGVGGCSTTGSANSGLVLLLGLLSLRRRKR